MLSGIHFLLTYDCTNECDHCFLQCRPNAGGTFTIAQLRDVFDEIGKIKSIDNVYFEGGEPFLYYQLMLEGIKMAREKGLKAGIVTNSYWATSVEDAELWLAPLKDLQIDNIGFSADEYHRSEKLDDP
ncbi:MAG: radical SAM protein, partial [candidate division Zixibacteria bacterium]|nr:radical SAM protein [candidate division Zixibacteria bacterium]